MILSKPVKPLKNYVKYKPTDNVQRSSLTSIAMSILRKYGADAHVYIPGIGTINGIQAGNWLDSAGTTAATVDNPVGLVMDGANTTLGPELVANGSFDNDLSGWFGSIGTSGWSWVNGKAYLNGDGTPQALYQENIFTIGKTYIVEMDVDVLSGGSNIGVENAGGIIWASIYKGRLRTIITNVKQTRFVIKRLGGTITGTVDNVSVKEIIGATPATQATTANKPILRQADGKYSWQFDGVNDFFSLGSVPFQMADDHCVVAGFSVSQITNQNTIFGCASTIVNASRVAQIFTVTGSGDTGVLWQDNKVVSASRTLGSTTLNQPYVVSAHAVGNALKGRRNGVSFPAPTSKAALGTTTIDTAAIGVSVRASNVGYTNGNIYAVIAIKGTVSDDDLLTLEKFVGQLSGVTI